MGEKTEQQQTTCLGDLGVNIVLRLVKVAVVESYPVLQRADSV